MATGQNLPEPVSSSVPPPLESQPVRDESCKPSGSATSSTDVTEGQRLRAQQETILHTVSHDLRTPLTVIIGQAQLALRSIGKAGGDGRQKRSIEAIIASGKRMNAMIQDLVDNTRLESDQLGLSPLAIDLGVFVRDVLQRAAGALDVGRVEIEAGKGSLTVSADPDRLERVIINLVSNALRYSQPDSPVKIQLRECDSGILTSIMDQGCGIEPHNLTGVFTKSHSGEKISQAEGLGFGLYITKMIVEAHGGRIWAESEYGRGSTFHFVLPQEALEDLGAS